MLDSHRFSLVRSGRPVRFLGVVVAGLALAVAASAGADPPEDQAVNLSRLPGVFYAYVDADGKALPPEDFGDRGDELTDRKGRTGGASSSADGDGQAIRIVFDFKRLVAPARVAIDRRWPRKTQRIDRVRVFTGDSPASLEENHVAEDFPKTYETKTDKKFSFDVPPSRGRFVRIDLEQDKEPQGGRISIREIEVWGTVAGTAPQVSEAEAAMLSAPAPAGEGAPGLAGLVGGIRGFTVLTREMGEVKVRKLLKSAAPQSVFVIEPGASWILTDTLVIPDEVTVYGNHFGRSAGFTFQKGFDGPLAHVGSWTTLHGVFFDGNKANFKGDGIVDPPGKGIREQRFVRVEVRNCEGNGFVLAVPHYYSWYQFCTFDRNKGYGVVYGEVRSHHTDNVWDSCHFGWNEKGGFAFHGVEASSIWENCEFFHNAGPAFDHFLINKKTGAGKPIGPRSGAGAGALAIRNTVIRNCPGPVWLNRGGVSEAIVFEDCRIKHNGHPRENTFTKDSGKSAEEMFGLSAPAGGVFHVEGGRLYAEIRGGFCRDNTKYFFTTGPDSEEGSRITISGACKPGHITGGIHAPNGYANIQDTSLLGEDAEIKVKSGIGLDPVNGRFVRYGPEGEIKE